MHDWMILERVPFVIFTAAGALLLALRMSDKVARAGWIVLLVASLGYAFGLTVQAQNLVNINIVHHYLGAKYPIPYSRFYQVTYAALERPQEGMHDLDHPPAYLRGEPAEQRAYYIDLLRAEGISFSPLSELATLRHQAIAVGAVKREADAILHHYIPAAMVDDFREDVRRAFIVEGAERTILAENRSIGDDYGYNGSPFYSLVRHADPSLYRPFDRLTAIINLVWQVLAIVCAAWLMGIGIGLGVTQRLAATALIFASWDLAGWALPGLIFAGLWLPIGIACWSISRGYMKVAGVAIAWSGLIKLFPYLLVLLNALLLVREAVHHVFKRTSSTSWRLHLRLLLSCTVASAVLILLTVLTGRSWSEFLSKILVQFQSQAYLLNSISLNQLLMVFGLFGSPVLIVLRVLLALILGIFLWVSPSDDSFKALPRRFILLLALTGWFVDTWFNYYALAALVLVPWAASSHRRGAAISTVCMAAAYLLPEFDSLLLQERHLLWFLKLLPYLAVPCWLAYLEFRPLRLGRRVKVLLITLVILCATLTIAETIRGKVVRFYEASGNQALDRGDAQQALQHFEMQLRISPWNGIAEMNKGISLAMLRRDSEALASFASAVSLLPSTVHTRINYGHMLFKLGRLGEALSQVEAVLKVSPCSAEALVERGRIQLAMARTEDARISLMRALELQPTNKAARDILQSL